jgi:glycine betaine catabolism A
MTLPQEYYASEEWFRTDLERIFARQWLYAGHGSQIPNSGDFLTMELGEESIIVVRGREGELYAHYNVCRHRGSRICHEHTGSVKKAFVCPYHGWSYGLDGALVAAPRMPRNFEKSDIGLKRAWAEEWHGLIYVSLREERPRPVAEVLALIEADCGPFQIEKTKVAHTVLYEVEANWKLIMENYRECYHCQMNHPEFVRTIDVEGHERGRRKQEKRYSPDFSFADLPLRPASHTHTISGEYASTKLLGDYASDNLPDRVVGLCWYPGNTMAWGPDHGTAFGLRPLSPTRTLAVSHWFVHEDAEEGVDYDVRNVIGLWDTTNRQDFWLSEINQQGVLSRAYEPGPYNLDMEDDVQQFIDAYFRMLDE